MKILNAKVEQRSFTLIDPPSVTSWVNVDALKVDFDEEWENYIKIACFEQGDHYQTVKMTGNMCTIPPFQMDAPVRIGIVGEDGANRITTTIDRIRITPSMYHKDIDDDGDFWNRVKFELAKKQNVMEEIPISVLDEMLYSAPKPTYDQVLEIPKEELEDMLTEEIE